MNNPARSANSPEGRLIEQARIESDLPQNEAARRAGISGTRWRQIVYERASEMTSSRGVKTLARMAAVVRIAPEQLADAGRQDIASALRASGEDPEPTVESLAAQVAELAAKVDRLLGSKDQGKAG